MYESTAVMLIKPPLSATSGEIGGNNPDRYVETQIGYMESANFIDRILKDLNTESRKSIRAAVKVEQRPNSDVVEITASTPNPDRSRRIAGVISETYLATFPDRNTGRFDKELKKVNEQIDQLNADLQKVEERRLRLPENPVTATERSAIARVNTDRDNLAGQLQQLRNTRSDLELNSDLIQQSEILQRADEADPAKSRALLYMIATLLLGLAGGASLAVALASGPRRLLTEEEIGESLGTPVAVKTPKVRELKTLSRKATEPHHRDFNQAIDRLSVRLDNSQVGDGAWTVLVAGANRLSGTTTLAMALAGRFAATGVRTVLVDANVKNPDISRLYGTSSTSGTDGLLLNRPTDDYRLETNNPNLSVVGVGRSVPLDRSNAFLLLERLEHAKIAEIIIIDGGPILDVISSARMSQMVNTVVLAVPTKFRGVRQLASLKRLLEGAAGTLHPVLTSPSRRSVAPSQGSNPSVVARPAEA